MRLACDRRHLAEAGLIAGFWSVLALLSLGSTALDARGPDWNSAGVYYTFAQFGFWAFLTPAIFWLCRRFPLDATRWARNLGVHVVAAFAGAFLTDLATDLMRDAISPRPFAFGGFSIFDDLLTLDILYELTVYLAPLAAGFARSYFLRLREREAREARLHARADRLQRQLTEARLQALRMQLNPHFLFNTLHAVSTLVGDDPGGVRRMIARLSELLRHVLDDSDRDEIPLREEMTFLRTYLEIMQIRFQGRLETTLDVAPGTEDALVPTLLLQPLVENAIKHGASEVEGLGRVSVEATRDEEMLRVCVRDNGPRFAPGDTPALETGTGLQNVRQRLSELHGDAARLRFRAADTGGLVAEVQLPFRPASADPHAADPAFEKAFP